MQIFIRNLQNKKVPLEPKKAKTTILSILKSCNIKRTGEIVIYFVDNKKIRELNLRYLNKDYPTDVLTFDISQDKKKIYADIFVSVDMAIQNSKIFKTSLSCELYLYIIHGILHLVGYNDKTKRQRKIMRKKELKLLNLLDLSK